MTLQEQLNEITADGPWSGTSSELCAILGTSDIPEHLSRELSRRTSELAAVSIRVTRRRQAHTGKRLWLIERVEGDGNRDQGDSRVTVTPQEGDSNPEPVTAKGDANPEPVTVSPEPSRVLDWRPCRLFQNGWCHAQWPQKKLNARALTACPLVGEYSYKWPD